ncbi:hypothetical protein HPB48_016630 [Haemaphysalis longicornis]|uniref:Uncharacterized protein n=1 Tax=Haemaphysalis longicornis TaxID=44386 RepID=A0A9J6FS35_HAELO|nr:hypothetical protein HPB48_016630 [Haemaphysalis longicornis]
MTRNIDLNNTSTSNLASTTMSRCPDAIHWNCRSLRTCANELNLLFGHVGHPALLLLQETRGTQPGIRGYDGYFQPAIVHTARHDSSERLVQAQAAVFLRRDVPHTPLHTAPICTDYQEVVSVRCKLAPRKTMLAISVYIRPDTSVRRRANFA